MKIVFVEGLWLWLLLLVPMLWLFPHRASNRVHTLIRSTLIILLILALARPAMVRVQNESYQVVVLDRSESVSVDVTPEVEVWVDELSQTARTRVVTLDGDRDEVSVTENGERLHFSGSSVGQALGAAARLIPEGASGAITLIGDGLSTDRHWGDAVRELVERDLPVHTIPLSSLQDEIYPSSILPLDRLRVGQTAKVAVGVVGKVDEAVVTLSSGEELLARSESFSSTGHTVVVLEFEPSKAGRLDVVANLEVTSGTDRNSANNLFRSSLAVQESILALYLGERLIDSRKRFTDLLGAGVELLELSQAEMNRVAENPGELQSFDLVMIDDRPSESISATIQESIVKAVKEDGVGLFYSGGKGAYGTGGYYNTPVASVLPVEMIQKEEKRDPSTTLVVIIDTSGSMSGERVQLAKECARLAIRRLLPHDKVGIVEFYGTKQWAAPIQSAANAIDIQRAINRLDAGGGTVILPAIEEAFYAMQNVQTRYKHVLVLTDGGVESGDFEGLMRKMSAKGINVSTVLVGSDAHSEFLVNIANWGKGHFYAASNRFNIPEILLKQPSTSKIPPYRPGTHLVSMGGPSGWWGELARPGEPKLSGYVETRLRPGAQVAVETETERHPVLASWRFGLGRVSALTTEPVGEGTAPWREWDDYGAWLLRVLSRTSREHPQPFAYTIDRSRSEARILARRLIDQPYQPRAERIDGELIEFQQRSPDVFSATIPVEASTTIHLRAGAVGWAGRESHVVSPASHAVVPELNVDTANAVDLSLLASDTGGQSVNWENFSEWKPESGGKGSAKDLYRLWPWCLVLALLAYLGDLLFRRWPGKMDLRMKNVTALILFIVCGSLSLSEVKAEISDALEEKLQATLREEPFQMDDGELYRSSLVENESLAPLLARLEEVIKEDEKAFGPIWLLASLQWRYGDFDKALEEFRKAEAILEEPAVMFRVGQILDARGEGEAAIEQYLKTLEAEPDDSMTERIRLRLALLKSTGVEVEDFEEDLPAYAVSRDQDFQNRAGVVLALTGKPEEALSLYQPDEEGNRTFKQLIRIAEWSMAAKDFSKAQEVSWNALGAAALRRDRRYALTVLAESYRSEGKLDELIQRFSETPDLSEEARMSWISLLREKGDAYEALALFQKAKDQDSGKAGFSAEMQRELLEICREAGRNDLLIENFEAMITKEPRKLEWRSGLCRFYLERGERQKGEAVWADYKEQAQRNDWLAAAGATMELGLDSVARSFAEELIESGEGDEPLAALQFLFELDKARGREEEMKLVLERMDELAPADASGRAQIAESWEQLGRQDKAIEILEKLRQARGSGEFSSDLETRLAWLYSETGAEEKAYEAWKKSWLRIDSPGRRRYVEDRLMATASRLGKLADIAIELEEKLADGTADKRDSGLLVRLYTKVGDPVSASEIIHDFMKQSGGGEIKMLEEQARVYVMCNDYYHYDKTLRKLMELDPEGAPEYLTQLAMSALERGRNDEARSILIEMRDLDANAASAEFEAGALKIAGMHEEAASAYWRGVGQNPDRIDAYLLLGQALQTLGRGKQAMGIFQYLVENAEDDDLFTIAIDGLLNMNNPQQGSRLDRNVLQWARRAILERLAGKDDKVYLFQLLSDVSEDLQDREMMMRSLAETLPVAGERRTSQLRELMELARASSKDDKNMMRFGRRLIGLGEIIPPQVYLDLGSVFLDNGDIRNAVKTFDYADGGLDYSGYQKKVASTFESKRFVRSALRSYEKLLLTQPGNVEVLVKIGEIKEQLGRDGEAIIAYRRALEVLVGEQPLFDLKAQASQIGQRISYYNRNADQFDKYFPRALTGLLSSGDPTGSTHHEMIDESLEMLKIDLEKVREESESNDEINSLTFSQSPRVLRRSRLIRRLCFVYGELNKGYEMEKLLLEGFPDDKTLLPLLTLTWSTWGYGGKVRSLIADFPNHPGNAEAGDLLGENGLVGARQVFQLIRDGDESAARAGLSDIESLLGDQWASQDFTSVLATARFFDDPAAIERLARYSIRKSPDKQKILQSIRVFTQVFPYLDEERRASLVSYLKSEMESRDDEGISGVSYYYFTNLKQLTGDELKFSIDIIRPQVSDLLAKGGRFTRYIAPLFSFLDRDEYRDLLREAYRNAKASDRLMIVFSLVAQYPGEMDPGLQTLFSELLEEAVESYPEDPLRLYQSNRRIVRAGSNSAFEARMLGDLANREKGEKQIGFLMEQFRAWHLAGNDEQGLEAVSEVLQLIINEKTSSSLIPLFLKQLPSDYLKESLGMLREMGGEDWNLSLEKKRVMLARQANVPELVPGFLREAIVRFPEEVTFRRDLQTALSNQGRFYEAIEVLTDLVQLDPENEQYRRDLAAAWTRLGHPLNARKYSDAMVSPPTAPTNPTPRPAGGPSSRPPASLTKSDGAGASESQVESSSGAEKPLEKASVLVIKKYHEAENPESAKVAFRNLWRQFAALDRASRSSVYRRPSVNSRYYEWPVKKASSGVGGRTNTPVSGSGGLNAFLAFEPLVSINHRQTPVSHPTLFKAIGSEGFVVSETEAWLRTFDAREMQGPLFEEMLTAVVQDRIAGQGADAFIESETASYFQGTLSALDQNKLLMALELYPENGGEAATRFLDDLLGELNPSDLWQALRMARCLVKRGEQEKAFLLYKWCGASLVSFRRSYTGSTIVNADVLVGEIRKSFEGETRVRMLDSVFQLMGPSGIQSSTSEAFQQFILTTWSEEVEPHEGYSRCPDICRDIIREFPTSLRRNYRNLELATLYLAAAGKIDDALMGMPHLFLPGELANISSSRKRRSRDYNLQQLFPEDMSNWQAPDQWMSGVVERIAQWAEGGQLPVADAIQILSVVAVRQHQNGFGEEARDTLTTISKMPQANPNAAVWFIDAAELTGAEDLAIDLATEQLRNKRLPINRVAGLIEKVVSRDGLDSANELAGIAYEYTAEPGFLKAMARLCEATGDSGSAELWEERIRLIQVRGQTKLPEE